MREVVERAINGATYTFSQYSTTEALKVLSRVIKIIGEPLIQALGSLPADGQSVLDRELNLTALSDAVGSLATRLDENEVVALLKKLGTEGVVCDNQPILFDLHYQGDLGLLCQVVYANLTVQYGNFFAVASKAAGGTKMRAVQKPGRQVV